MAARRNRLVGAAALRSRTAGAHFRPLTPMAPYRSREELRVPAPAGPVAPVTALRRERSGGAPAVRFRRGAHFRPVAPVPRRDVKRWRGLERWPGLQRWRGLSPVVIVMFAMAVAANALTVFGLEARWVLPVCGLVLGVALPARLMSRILAGRVEGPGTRWACSVALDLFVLMAGGLAMNEILPVLGVGHPLDRGPVYGLLDLVVVAMVIAQPASVTRMPTRLGLRTADLAAVGASAACVGLTVLGAVRLNNDAGGGVALFAMAASALLALGLLVASERVGRGPLALSLWGLSLAFLWGTSLRGWYVTGHDIQLEFQVFSATTQHGQWLIHATGNSYSACLSVSILPQLLLEVTHVFAPLVFKAYIPLFFALCPVVLYESARRILGARLGIAAGLLFVAFPTYTNDMVFLDRQEVALLFVAVALALVTSGGRALPHRTRIVLVLLTGMVIAHYSTAYVFTATAVGGFVLNRISNWVGARIAARRAGTASIDKTLVDALGRQERRKPVLGPAALGILLAVVVVWSAVASQAEPGQFSGLLSSTASGFLGQSSGVRSSVVDYSVLPQGAASPDQQLTYYKRALAAQYPDPVAAGYYPSSLVRQYPVRAAPTAVVPRGALGRGLSAIGIGPYGLNNFVHNALARLFQILAIIGLVAVFLGWARAGRITAEHVFWAIASLVLLVATVVMPVLSVNYGLLRLFQQALLVLAPVILVGSLAVFTRLGRKWATRITCGICMLFLFALTGLMPQLTGGFTPTLNLNNSGEYYENYYTQASELSAAAWLNANVPTRVAIQANPFLTSRMQAYVHIAIDQNDFPPLLYRNSFVMLGSDTTQTGIDTAGPYNDLIDYQYPRALLARVKDLVYSAGGATIYHSSQ